MRTLQVVLSATLAGAHSKHTLEMKNCLDNKTVNLKWLPNYRQLHDTAYTDQVHNMLLNNHLPIFGAIQI